MRVFVRVAQRAGFAAAARELRLSPASVTKHVAATEARLGVRLLDRTTRHVSLTEAGRVYLERSIECLQAAEDADAAVTSQDDAPRGVLRVSAPVDLQAQVARALGHFVEKAPHVTVDLQVSNRAIDLVEEGVDVAIRVAPALEGAFVARPLAPVKLVVAGAPAYFRRHGRPRRPADLAQHRAIVFAEPRPRVEWTFTLGRRTSRVTLRPVLTTNGGDAIRTAASAGVGLTIAPSFLLGSAIASGALETPLEDWTVGPPLRVYAIYPHRRFLAPKVRAFVEALQHGAGDWG